MRKRCIKISENYSIATMSDYFRKGELEKKINLYESKWTLCILKELIDNALEAVEIMNPKHIHIEYGNDTLSIFDNGIEFTLSDLEEVYNFNKYYTGNRHRIRASRGKQGIGLKSIIGISYIQKYDIAWHTSDGIIREMKIDADKAEEDILNIIPIDVMPTNKKGIEISGLKISFSFLESIIKKYIRCNPDVNFKFVYNDIQFDHTGKEAVNRAGEISLAFFSYKQYEKFVKAQKDKDMTYKQFLSKNFNTRISNYSQIASKLSHLDYSTLQKDFEYLRESQNKKSIPY